MYIVPAFGLSSIQMPELLVVLLIVLVFFGAGKLPTVFKQLGSGVKAFKDAQKEEDSSGVEVSSAQKSISSDALSDAEEVGERVKE